MMRHLRQQLIQLLDQARRQHRMDQVQPRLMAVLVQDFLTLLPRGKRSAVEMRSRSLSHGNLHRHIFTIRCPDQAFYLDAIKGYLLQKGIQPIGQQTMVARMLCGPDGCDLELRDPDIHDEDNFMFIALHISATLCPDPEPIRLDIQAILRAVDLSVSNFSAMRKAVAYAVARLMPEAPDAAALLDWMNDNHYLYFALSHGDQRLGLMKNRRVMQRVVRGLEEEIAQMPAPQQAGVSWWQLPASQHYLYSEASVEVVRVCWTEPEHRINSMLIVGHFSRSARFANASYLPVMATAWRTLAGDPLLQHSAFYRREIRTLFDRIPKRILLATEPADWLEPLKAIIDLADPMQLVSAVLRSRDGHLDTLMIAIAAKRYGPVVLQRILDTLGDAGMRIHGYESFGTGPHRLIFIGVERASVTISRQRCEELIRRCIIFWKDLAKAEVLRHADLFDIPATLQELEHVPPLYQELFPPAQFSRDLQMRRRLLANGRTCVHVTSKAGSRGDKRHEVELRIYAIEQSSLGELVDTIRSFALDPVQESVIPFGRMPDGEQGRADAQGDCACIHISSLICRAPHHLDSDAVARLRRGLAQVLNGEADHDPLNALVVLAGLSIEEVAILITLRNHLVQLMPDAARMPLSEMMMRHPNVAAALQQLFAAHHLPAMPDSFLAESRAQFHAAMGDVASLADDRWFRALADLVEASLRTNAYMRQSGAPIGIKIDPRQLDFAPDPKPWREIFVHGVHVEGVHLRAGPIARGGLRFSDRPADFRTEVLELMSTQVVKNGQIVPTGSKGGFVVRDGAGADFVLAQYRLFIRTMLGLTDNLVDGAVVAPEGIVIAETDRDDPYFVVAADKGTARYSDDANAESNAAGFWLGDAFASGGRYGYDHKAVGITARGAWVCAEHHFAKMGIDASADPISCVAIGDMGGDVFGNGMLLNPALKLVAAFNHQHIFLDPEPDAAKAFAERQRLFVEVAGWGAYRKEAISRGGGVFARSAKSIPLSKAVQRVLQVEAEALSGEALIQAILAAPVDLLYNGGIGTYVKASSETHAEVRDPANNSVRIDAERLRCKVVCEGGNLGFTQLARIAFARNGGVINTDAMDNSAGVDMSDHEVNLKILLSSLPGRSLTMAARNRLLKRLTDAVTAQCLRDNLLQSRVLTLAEDDIAHFPPRMARLRDRLSALGWLDVSMAPEIDNDELLPLRPQLSILVGQEKNRIHAALSEAGFAASSAFSTQLLQAYFPDALKRRFGDAYAAHPLADEIIHTEAANHIVNHFGLTAVHHLETMVDCPIEAIAEALLIAEAVFDLPPLREAIWQAEAAMGDLIRLQRMLQEQMLLFAEALLRLTRVSELDGDWIARQRRGVAQFRKAMMDAEPGDRVPEHHCLHGYARELETLLARVPLAPNHAAQLLSMPQLARAACAIALASQRQLPLKRCLQASQACLAVLPIEAMETPLRSPEWGRRDEHALRREWLHRLTHLQLRALEQLLAVPGNHFAERAAELWQRHRYWPELEQFCREQGALEDSAGEPRRAEARRMHLLLALTRLEAVVDNL